MVREACVLGEDEYEERSSFEEKESQNVICIEYTELFQGQLDVCQRVPGSIHMQPCQILE